MEKPLERLMKEMEPPFERMAKEMESPIERMAKNMTFSLPRTFMDDSIRQTIKYHEEIAQRGNDIYRAAISLPHLLSGSATFDALVNAVEQLSRVAPDDCDVIVEVGDLAILNARFIEPHTLSFEGLNQDGHRASIVIHFSQLHARVIYRPKRGASRIITGFSHEPS